jgi:hypothetical protein
VIARSTIRWSVCLTALLVAGAAGRGAAHVPRAAVTIRIKGVGGRKRKTGTGAWVADASTGEVVAAAGIGQRGRITLRPPAGVEMLVATAERKGEVRLAISAPFHFDGTKTTKVKMTLVTEAPLAQVNARLASAALGGTGTGGGNVGTMGTITLNIGNGLSGNVAGPIFTPLFNDTTGTIRWVDTSQAVQQWRQRELDLQSNGQLDPSTPIRDNPLGPDFVVEGELSLNGDRVQGEIRIVDPTTGQEIGRLTIDEPDGPAEEVFKKIADKIADEIRRLTTTSTTTTTTTSTSTTTSTTTTTTTVQVSTTTLASTVPHTLQIVFDGHGTWSQTVPSSTGAITFSASVDWHAVYLRSLPDLAPIPASTFGAQVAGAGTTVTGNSSISGTAGCTGPIVVNTNHGQGPPAPQAQTPFLTQLPSPQAKFAADAMGGYDYRLCDGEYNIGEGAWEPGEPDLPNYAGAPFFTVFSFDLDSFTSAPFTQEIIVGITQQASDADVTWSGTVTLTSMP